METITIPTKDIKKWTTHMPMLIRTLLATNGTVVEVGGGLYSTPFLHWMCKIENRKLITYESDIVYYKLCKSFSSRYHSVRLIENWDNMDFIGPYSVVLIDHGPRPRRIIDVINFKDTAEYVVMHDSDYIDCSAADKVFKYKYEYKGAKPCTVVYSNFNDLSKITL